MPSVSHATDSQCNHAHLPTHPATCCRSYRIMPEKQTGEAVFEYISVREGIR
ncbi:hypothetical protein AB9N12_09620 [Bacteroides sp. AN502(2024)]|uniref:hypothetical protein n=1 Tax=Bacteroides sp. AN502(2024) TaxID=3160599 RepID=UPI003511612A